MAATEKIRDALPRVASVGDATSGSVNEDLLFLALKPAKGGVCTDLIAWRYCELGFFQTLIFFEGLLNGCYGTSIARLDGIPHGISASIAASVNVVVVHSPVIGKLWIFSAKYSKGEHSTAKSDGTEPGHSHTKESVLNNAMKDDVATLDSENHEKGLHLYKCAVVDCNGPVYTMHLSLQHLLVGQLGGVRVWLLRPLIKGSAVARKDFKAEHHHGRCTGAKQERNKILEGQECGKKIVETHRSCNGQHSAALEGIGTVRTSKGLCPVMAASKNGFYEMSLLQCDRTKLEHTNGFSSTEGNTFSKKEVCGCSGKPSEDIFSSCNGCSNQNVYSDVRQDAASNAPKLVQFEEAIIPAYRNGTSFEFDPEELKSQQKLSQFSTFSSSSDSASSLLFPHTTCTRSASCQSLSSSLSSVVGASGTTGAYHKTEAGKGTQAGVFVSLQKNQLPLSMSTSLTNIEQVTGIHGLSEKDFVVLDSHGKMHLLTLQYLARGDEAKLHRAPRILFNASLQPLTCGIKIKLLTVLPDLHSDKRNSDFASRVLWVSDGCHTVYIVAVPAGESSKQGSGKGHLLFKSNPTVIGTVFLTERALLLSALHENAVMVLTEGSMVAYSSTGA